ncbi:hypothetical protein LDL77_06420 [Flagellimonas marinaquae]|uniref:hypothetical protein n=1 Tax=Flagellimonas aurea TaxID=2915619 RepID=UPI001CE08D06|nr:hypothetical protein LDL77_06420 [Allomuricauda aquimarina]
MKKPTPKTASNIEKLSKNSYDIAFKEFEKSLGGSSEQDSIKAKWAAAIIKQMNMISWANKLYQDLNSETKLDHSILLEVLDMIYSNKRCDENLLFKYIELQFEIKIFQKNIAKWHDDEYALPFGVDYFLLGLPMKYVTNDYLGILGEAYGEIYCDFYYGKSNNARTNYMIDYTKKSVKLIKDVISSEAYKQNPNRVQ